MAVIFFVARKESIMAVKYDEDGVCTTCGQPGSGFVEDGVCHCLDED